ncbi:hypothetical protein ACHAPJ_006580 [Fusarium lateritium]
MKRLSKLKKKLLSSASDARPSPPQVSVPPTASSTEITTPPSHQSTSSPAQPTNGPSTAPPANSLGTQPPCTAAAEPVTDSLPSVETQDVLPSLPERLWNKAYAGLEEEEPDIVNAYQEILQKVENEWTDTTAPDDLENLEHCKGIESRQMWRLVYTGLEESKRQAKHKESVSNVLGIVESIKGVVDKAVKYSSEAGVVWAGVSLGLEILSNPMKEPGLNRKGIAYVLSRMEWYWNMADLVLSQSGSSSSSTTLRTNLETHVIDFYKKLLLFQIRSACLYYRNWMSILLRDAVRLDDWTEKLNGIKDAENLVRKDIEQYNSEDVKLKLQDIEKSAVSREGLLESIYTSLREEARLEAKNRQDDKDKECLAALLITDPQIDKKRLQDQKGDPLWESYHRIFNSAAYQHFTDDPSSRVLWINGPPGKGKTMLLCGMIDGMKHSLKPLSFFFCQATVKEEDLSSDTAVMRGLIYVLLDYQPSLLSILRPYYDKKKEKLFNSVNSSEIIGEILTNMLKHPSLQDAILVLDALDECKFKRTKLAKLVCDLSKSCSAKWVISSRDWPEIQQELGLAQGLISLSLEDEQEPVSKAVKSYIRIRVDELARKWGDDAKLKESVFDYMNSHADNTFLWVALVCEKLGSSSISKRGVLEEVKKFPQSLNALYQVMMERIMESSEADRLKQILATTCIAYRTLTSKELIALIEMMEGYTEDDVKDVIGFCGSFLIYQEDKILFVHQSAKEFLLNTGLDLAFPYGTVHQHSEVFLRSIQILESVLRENIYDVDSPGTLIDELSPPSTDPLRPIEYLCVYWGKHLIQSANTENWSMENLNKAFDFLQQKLTCWLEALSLLRHLAVAVSTILDLESLLADMDMRNFSAFVHDARRFIYHHKPAIEIAPLQVYASALVFSPRRSKVREQFNWQVPEWIELQGKMEDDWGTHIQTLYVKSGSTRSIAHSRNDHFLAVATMYTVSIYETGSGDCVYYSDDNLPYASVAFSADGTLFAVGSQERIEILEVGSFESLQKLDVDTRQLLFLPGNEKLVVEDHQRVFVLDWKTGQQVSSLGLIIGSIGSGTVSQKVAVLPTGDLATVFTGKEAVKIWDVATGHCKCTLGYPGAIFEVVTCSPDGDRIAITTSIGTVEVWHSGDADDWNCKQKLVHGDSMNTVLFLAGGRMLILTLTMQAIGIWDDEGICLKTLQYHSDKIKCLSLSQSGQRLASGTRDGTVKLWDVSTITISNAKEPRILSAETSSHLEQKTERDPLTDGAPSKITYNRFWFSSSGSMLVSSSSRDGTKIWDMAIDTHVPLTLTGAPSGIEVLRFSHDDRIVALKDEDGDLGVWDTDSWERIYSFGLHVDCVAISTDRRILTLARQPSVKQTKTVFEIWDLTSRTLIQQSEAMFSVFETMVISDDARYVASYNLNGKTTIWNRNLGDGTEDLKHCVPPQAPVAFSPDSRWLLTRDLYFEERFNMREMISPYTSKKLDFPQSKVRLGSRSISRGTAWKVATWLGVLSPGQPDEFKDETRIGWGTSLDRDWIMRDNKRMLWVPVEYRNLELDIHGSRVAFLCPSGHMAILKLQRDGG